MIRNQLLKEIHRLFLAFQNLKTLIDNAEDLDIVMPMYNLLEYSKNYSKTTGRFWNYYRDEPNSGANNNINCSIKDSKLLQHRKRS